jgi:hypothetical protein
MKPETPLELMYSQCFGIEITEEQLEERQKKPMRRSVLEDPLEQVGTPSPDGKTLIVQPKK